jgi:hypothetical protein
MSDLFQIDNFNQHLNTQFTFTREGSEPISAELVEVKGNGHTFEGRGKENFSLLFNDTENPALNQGMVTVNHPQMGEFSIFIVPVIPDRKGICYQSVFSFMPD